MRVGEGRRAPVGHDKVERGVRQRHRLGARVNEPNVEPVALQSLAGACEPRLRIVEADTASAEPRQRTPPLRCTPAELAPVLARYVDQALQPRLGPLPHTPREAALDEAAVPLL